MTKFPIDYNDRKPIGRTGETVSAIGLGTWAIRNYENAFKVFMYAIEHGIDNIDTAEMYDNGKAEEFVGKIINIVGKEKVFITTKMLPHHLISKEEVLKAAKASLKRLGLSTVDLFLIHWPNDNIPIEVQVRNFEVVYEKGLARYIGVSNFDVLELEEAIHATRKAEIVVNQVYYNVLAKHVEKDLLPYAIKHGITLQAYTPLEKSMVAKHPVIIEIARKINKTPIQVALNYLISRPNVVAIPKTENISHLKEILGAMGWRLGEKEITVLEKI
ncbi:aldo/keto reductase [Desulfurococcaceae archaeon MEX13E-LK6-19]|nr:aldo/keto reductase [Desulfurococcaceae archaeon MEX13E-LK6-19]